MNPRVFTLEQARKTLPLVSRIAGDVKKSFAEAFSKRELLTLLESGEGSRPAGDRGEQERTLRSELEEALGRISDCAMELKQLGIELKDPQIGLVDFYTRHEDRFVYLCWCHGEETINHWHELDVGYAGRRPVSELDPW